MTERKCPACNGKGVTSLDMSKIFTACIGTIETAVSKKSTKKRVRLEIKHKLVEEFLHLFGEKGEVALFIMPLNKISVEDILD